MAAPPTGLPWRLEQARFAKTHIPQTKNPLVRELALLILEEYPHADPPPQIPHTRVGIAAQRAVKKLKKPGSATKALVDASIYHVNRALQAATAQLENKTEWRGRTGRYGI